MVEVRKIYFTRKSVFLRNLFLIRRTKNDRIALRSFQNACGIFGERHLSCVLRVIRTRPVLIFFRGVYDEYYEYYQYYSSILLIKMLFGRWWWWCPNGSWRLFLFYIPGRIFFWQRPPRGRRTAPRRPHTAAQGVVGERTGADQQFPTVVLRAYHYC